MKQNDSGDYLVIHPLDDAPEQKCAVLAPMQKSVALLVILVILRLYLFVMAIIIVIAVLRTAHVL